MQLHVTHTTRYAYDAPVIYGLQKIRLRPVASHMQSVSDWTLTVTGGKIECSYTDHHGNLTDLVSITPEGDAVEITAQGTINTEDTHGVFGKVYGRVPLYLLRMPTSTTEAGPKIKAFARTLDKHDDLLTGLHALSAAILKAVPYESPPPPPKRHWLVARACVRTMRKFSSRQPGWRACPRAMSRVI